MENIADALKIIFAVMVFAIACSLLFQTASLARRTSEVLISEEDRTNYYTYMPEDVTSLDDEGNRIVTLEDIIPTLYRYSIESYGVTIIDGGEIVARFDKETENLCSGFSKTNDNTKNLLIKEINNYVLNPVNAKNIYNISELEELFKKIYKQIGIPGTAVEKQYNCAWNGKEEYIAQRIDSDLSGITVYFNINSLGSQGSQGDSENHVPCIDNRFN